MAKKRKWYTAEEAAEMIQHDTMEDSIENVLCTIVQTDEQFDQQLLQDVANKIVNRDQIIDQVDFEVTDALNGRTKGSPDAWKQNVAKKRRALGEEYFGKKYVNGQWIYVAKPARKMRQLCARETCKNSNKRHCDEFTDEDCKTIFQSYWSAGDKRMQCTFTQSLVDVVPKQASQGNNRRQFSRIFHLKRNGLSWEVCKDMFLNTLSISGQKLQTVLEMDNENIGITVDVIKSRNPRPSKGFRWAEEDQAFLKEFFEKIPKAPGHYCRKDSSKIYLSSAVHTITKLHQVYKARCGAFGKRHFAITKFKEYFDNNNFSLFKRKKDMCNICITKNVILASLISRNIKI